jgi:hypothetical protein
VTLRLTVFNHFPYPEKVFLAENWDGPVVDIVIPVAPRLPTEATRHWSDTQIDNEAIHRLELAGGESRTIDMTYEANEVTVGPAYAYGILWRGVSVPGARTGRFEGYYSVAEEFILGNSPGFGRLPPSAICRDPLPYEQSLPAVRPGGG